MSRGSWTKMEFFSPSLVCIKFNMSSHGQWSHAHTRAHKRLTIFILILLWFSTYPRQLDDGWDHVCHLIFKLGVCITCEMVKWSKAPWFANFLPKHFSHVGTCSLLIWWVPHTYRVIYDEIRRNMLMPSIPLPVPSPTLPLNDRRSGVKWQFNSLTIRQANSNSHGSWRSLSLVQEFWICAQNNNNA